jgi:hypothetical protein
MSKESDLEIKIEKLRQHLRYTAEENEFNFQHPKVLQLSKELDFLIIQLMKLNTIQLCTV